MNSALYPKRPPCDPMNPVPRYVQVRDWLEGQIRSGALRSHDKLPAEKDWAPLLGVSQMTLNRAIQVLVRDGLIIREVGRGTFVADPSRSVETVHVGLILHWQQESDGGYYGTQMVHGIYHAVANRPAQFSFAWGLETETEAEDHYIELARKMGVDAMLLVIPPAHALSALVALQKTGLPFVVVGASWEDRSLPCVDFDNATGTEMAVSHLLDLGHRQVGIVGGTPYLRTSKVRIDTFHRVLKKAGVPFHPEWEVISPSFQMDEASLQRLRALLESGRGPTAYYAAGYYLSMQTAELIQSLGLRIPADVSVVGFGDPFAAAYMSPPLTTIRHPVEELGELAANRLLDGVSLGRAPRDTDILPVEFVERRSTAPPSR